MALQHSWAVVFSLNESSLCADAHPLLLLIHCGYVGTRLGLLKVLMCNQEVCLSFGVHDLDALIALFTAADEIEMLLEWFLQLRLELHPSKAEFAAQLFTAMYHAQLKTAQGFRDFQQLLFKVSSITHYDYSSSAHSLYCSLSCLPPTHAVPLHTTV